MGGKRDLEILPKKSGETTLSAKAGGMDPVSSYPKCLQNLQKEAGESLFHVETSGTSKKCQGAPLNHEDGMNQSLAPSSPIFHSGTPKHCCPHDPKPGSGNPSPACQP